MQNSEFARNSCVYSGTCHHREHLNEHTTNHPRANTTFSCQARKIIIGWCAIFLRNICDNWKQTGRSRGHLLSVYDAAGWLLPNKWQRLRVCAAVHTDTHSILNHRYSKNCISNVVRLTSCDFAQNFECPGNSTRANRSPFMAGPAPPPW